MTMTGHQAIEYAARFGLTLSKYADPTEDAREGLTLDEAREIAREDPELIYVEMDQTLEDRRRRRNRLREMLWADDEFAHRWLCHPDGAPCPDGCDTQPSPRRAAFYGSPMVSATTYAIRTISGRGLPTGTDAAGYDTRLAAEEMADAFHDGEYEIVAVAHRDGRCYYL